MREPPRRPCLRPHAASSVSALTLLLISLQTEPALRRLSGTLAQGAVYVASRRDCGRAAALIILIAMGSAEHWEHEALNWIGLTRGARPDAYSDYASRFFDFLPSPQGRALEVGCGEGRVCRDMKHRGFIVTGVDISPTLVDYAQRADPEGDYQVADACSLPFEDQTFDLAVAYNSLMDVDELDGTVQEIARVLRPGGLCCACITHPLADAGRFVTREASASFVIDGSYLRKRRFELPVTRNGVTMTFSGWSYPLETYSRALEAAGLLLEALREPPAPDTAVALDQAEARWQRIPAFLFFRARKLS